MLSFLLAHTSVRFYNLLQSEKHLEWLLLGEVHLSHLFVSPHSAGKLFQVCVSEARRVVFPLLLEGMDSMALAMCAICSCLCGDRMAAVSSVCSIWGADRASRLGSVRPSRGCGRRHPRHNLSLTEKPESPCKNREWHSSKDLNVSV